MGTNSLQMDSQCSGACFTVAFARRCPGSNSATTGYRFLLGHACERGSRGFLSGKVKSQAVERNAKRGCVKNQVFNYETIVVLYFCVIVKEEEEGSCGPCFCCFKGPVTGKRSPTHEVLNRSRTHQRSSCQLQDLSFCMTLLNSYCCPLCSGHPWILFA